MKVSKTDLLRVLFALHATGRIREKTRVACVDALLHEGLVVEVTPGNPDTDLLLTDRGAAYVAALQRLPYPEQVTQWTVPEWSAEKHSDVFQAELRG